MILKTILNGKEREGYDKKAVMHPYAETSIDFVQYSQNLTIDPFIPVKDILEFRSELCSAADTIRAYFGKNKKNILKTSTDETGSPVVYHADDLKHSRAFLGKIRLLEKLLPKKYRFEPKGNVLLIFSSNEPIISVTVLIFSSLFMGNIVFVKPSSKTPSFAYFLVKELIKFPVLEKRIHYLLVNKDETERLIRANSFDFVLSFGNRFTNKSLGIICAESEVNFLQESEGNDWVYVDKDYSSLKKVGGILSESFTRHNGQMCNAVRGILVHSSIYGALVEEMKKYLSFLPVGNPQLRSTRIGSVIAGTAENAHRLVTEASSQSENIWNFSLNGNIISPTIILNPDGASAIILESIFAPAIWIRKVESPSDAISFYNEKNMHGLGFSVFSDDKETIDLFIKNIRAGRININKDPLDIDMFDPLGGIKISGREGPSSWVEKISNRKYISR